MKHLFKITGGDSNMELTITDEAVDWYINEMELQKGTSIKFFVRYGGCGGVQPGLSLGVALDTPNEPIVKVESKGILFFVEEKDAWYFDQHNLHIEYNSVYNEVEFKYL
jgi:uncharacterized protein YneR